jgi:predicted O-methyltransferase YrrM
VKHRFTRSAVAFPIKPVVLVLAAAPFKSISLKSLAFPLQKLIATRHAGGSSVNNLRLLDRLTKEHSPRTTLEIGLGTGSSALLFASYHQAAGHGPGAHTAIDPYQTSPTAFASAGLHALQRAGLTEFVTHRNGLSALELPRLVADGTSFDMIYVDGSHLFEDVFVDAYFSMRLLTPNGILLFDDSAHAQPLKVVRFLRANMRGCLREIDLTRYSDRHPFVYRVARMLERVQLTAFRRIGETERSWEEWGNPLRSF